VTTDGSLQGTRVLIARASESARTAMRTVLEGVGCAVAEAGTREELLDVARNAGADVLLLHAELGCALSELKRDPDLFRIAVVLIDGPSDVAAAVDALEHGAHDLLREDAPPGELVARVGAARRAGEMQEQLLTREHELEAMAYYDELTGVANRRFAVRQLHALLSRARRHGQHLSVVLLDIDGFKALNDRHGHAVGDEVLAGVAERLSSRARTEDVVARFGGEEFLVILPDTGADGAATVAEDLHGAVGGTPIEAGAGTLRVTVSAGWAAWDDESLDRLIARADAGLYAAKEAGRDRVRPGPAAGAARR
jgi:two-component system, cell cycle response regulator